MATVPYSGDIIFFNGGEEYVINTLKKTIEFDGMSADIEKILKGCQHCLSDWACVGCPYDEAGNPQCYEQLKDDVDSMYDKIRNLLKTPDIQRREGNV